MDPTAPFVCPHRLFHHSPAFAEARSSPSSRVAGTLTKKLGVHSGVMGPTGPGRAKWAETIHHAQQNRPIRGGKNRVMVTSEQGRSCPERHGIGIGQRQMLSHRVRPLAANVAAVCESIEHQSADAFRRSSSRTEKAGSSDLERSRYADCRNSRPRATAFCAMSGPAPGYRKRHAPWSRLSKDERRVRTVFQSPGNEKASGIRGYPLYFSQYSGMISCTWASISSGGNLRSERRLVNRDCRRWKGGQTHCF